MEIIGWAQKGIKVRDYKNRIKNPLKSIPNQIPNHKKMAHMNYKSLLNNEHFKSDRIQYAISLKW